jgi:pimeloyl-ACP methyl ester carboxylesterase
MPEISLGTVIALSGAGAPSEAPVVDGATQIVEIDTSAGLAFRVSAAVRALEELNSPAHLIASGSNGPVAIRVTTTRPDLIRSIVLVDSTAQAGLDDVAGQLPSVSVPALIITGSPAPGTDLSASQTLAGQIPNGVFVVIDNVEPPVNRTRLPSFQAWVASFFSIVEGLQALDDGPADRPAPPPN